jgi:glycerol-3-phosphate dehydrogenase (NAD(P)+)
MAVAAVIGATTWGNTIGSLLANKGIEVRIWARTESRVKQFTALQEKALRDNPDIGRPRFTGNIKESVSNTDTVIFAVPAQTVRHTVELVSDEITPQMVLVSLAKGLEANSGKRMTEVILEEVPATAQKMVCVLSGPNLSQEINRGLPATSILAASDSEIAVKTQKLFNTPNFTVFISDDVVGVEVCGALKNVIALGAGMIDGLGLGNNAKATLITFGWNEAVRLGMEIGASLPTFYGLAGLGDLITTSAGSLSRNHYVGREVASGRTLAEVKSAMANIAEGPDTAAAVHRLNHRLKLELPVIELIYRILHQSLPPVELANRLAVGFRKKPAAN